MDALDEYGSSDNESAGAPASNAVPAALTSPPGSPSTRNAAQALVQFSQGAAHQVTAQHKPRPRLVVPPTGTSSASTAFAGHLGVRASAIMPDVDGPAPTQGEVLGETSPDDDIDYDSDVLEDVPGRSVGGKSSRESVTAGQGRRAADPRPRKTSRKQTQAGWTMICEGVSMPVVEEQLQTCAQVELGHAVQWSRGVWKPKIGMNRDGVRRQLYRCPFRGPANCNCTAELRVTQGEDDLFTLERKNVPHADHKINNKKRGLSKHTKMVALSPNKMDAKSHQAVRKTREEIGALTDQQRSQLLRARKQQQRKDKGAVVPHHMRQTFGGINMWAQAHTPEALQEKQQFGAHTLYVCGPPIIDSVTQNVSIAYSTENLLLNAYRQQQHGFPSIVQVDCTHRLVIEGHLCMLFGTVDAGQHFHKIGYGLCAKEDEHSHQHVFRALKTEVERIVAQRIRDQQKI